jgi:CMP-N-acetylneuraminic acid synthetase
MAIAIIPARGGSTRIPRKNIKDFHGRPIIAYSIETAKESGLFDRIIVSTDDDEIADIAKEYGAEIHLRREKDAQDDVGTQAVMKQVLIDIEASANDYVCCLYATAPLLAPDTLVEAYGAHELMYEFQYIAPIAEWLTDPGQFYCGEARYFLNDTPLEGRTYLFRIDPRTSIDINTMSDWLKAEVMYETLNS